MIKSQKIKILWLSDIHFSAKYEELSESDEFEKFINTFILSCSSEHKKSSPIQFIFLTGDLAQQGTKEDYGLFKSVIMDKLLHAIHEKGFPIPKVITIPGNHDVMWDNDEFLNKYLDKINPEINQIPKRHAFLDEEKPSFENLFHDYSIFQKNERQGNFAEFYNFNGLTVSDDYEKHNLFGFIIDKKNKLAVVLLNTAWFSLGTKFNKLYAKEIIKQLKAQDESALKITQAKLEKWFKTKDILTEYSSQITGINIFPLADFFAFLEDHSDYFILTAMHHPRNWLEWEESYSYQHIKQDSVDYDSRAELLNELIKLSDVILTGHEHVPANVDCDRILGNVLHLKGGCFLEDNQNNKISFGKSWYSILLIDNNTREVEQIRYRFDLVSKNWIEKTYKYLPSTFLNHYALSKDRERDVTSAIINGTRTMLYNYFKSYFSVKLELSNVSAIYVPEDDAYHIYKIIKENVAELCVISRHDSPYRTCFNKESFFHKLKAILRDHSEVKSVRFLVLDLFVDGDSKKGYFLSDCVREEVLNVIVKTSDNLFDVFRHGFFMHWEDLSEVESAPAIEDFSHYCDLKMINHIIPYWISERFWFNRLN